MIGRTHVEIIRDNVIISKQVVIMRAAISNWLAAERSGDENAKAAAIEKAERAIANPNDVDRGA